jgi:hypothetical protein
MPKLYPQAPLISVLYNAKQQTKEVSLVLVAHTCNPSYSGGSDQED